MDIDVRTCHEVIAIAPREGESNCPRGAEGYGGDLWV